MRGNFYKKGEIILGVALILLGITLSLSAFYFFVVKEEFSQNLTENHQENFATTTKDDDKNTAAASSTNIQQKTNTQVVTSSEEKKETCQNQCSQINLKRCFNSGYQTCGNYDSDSCFEWSDVLNCGSGLVCSGGECLPSCSNECLYSGAKQCYGEDYQICGNYDSDTCLEWSRAVSCPTNYVCQSGNCAYVTLPVPTVSWCEVDYSEAPEMASFAAITDEVCEENYPKISQKLNSADPSQKISIIFKENQEAPGMTSGSVISLSRDWFLQNSNDLGAIVHEITHVVQAYPSYVFWPTEGIADYIRYWLGYQTSWSYAHCGSSESYASGYGCSAAFLQYTERIYNPNIISRLNTALKGDYYSDSLFEAYTGKTVSQLWEECKNYDCIGGAL